MKQLFWMLLSIPAIAMVVQLASGTDAADLLHSSGETSARLLIVALLLTPLRLLLPDVRWLSWLRQQRRSIGVAAFAYAALHTIFYLADMGSLKYVLDELTALGIWTGWLAFLIFIPLALTSNNTAVRRLAGSWATLHRLVYAAALLTLVHWIYVHNNYVPAWVHFIPLILLEIYRVYAERKKT